MKTIIEKMIKEFKDKNLISYDIPQKDFAKFTCDSFSYEETSKMIKNSDIFKEHNLSIYTFMNIGFGKEGKAIFTIKLWKD